MEKFSVTKMSAIKNEKEILLYVKISIVMMFWWVTSSDALSSHKCHHQPHRQEKENWEKEKKSKSEDHKALTRKHHMSQVHCYAIFLILPSAFQGSLSYKNKT